MGIASESSESSTPVTMIPAPSTPSVPICSPSRKYAKTDAKTGSTENMITARVGVVSFWKRVCMSVVRTVANSVRYRTLKIDLRENDSFGVSNSATATTDEHCDRDHLNERQLDRRHLARDNVKIDDVDCEQDGADQRQGSRRH